MTLDLERHNKTDPKSEMLSAVLAGNRIQHDERNIRGFGHAHMIRKYDILDKETRTR